MLTKRFFSVLVVSVVVMAFSSAAVAQAPMARLARLKNYLALTDKQVSDIRDLLKNHQQAVFPLRQDMRARNHELQTALDTAEPNPATVGQLVIAQHALRTQLQALNVKLNDDITAKLTPEQQQKFEQLKARFGRRARRG